MILSKIAVQKMEVVEKNQPDLFISIKIHESKEYPGYMKLGVAAGLMIESVLKSKGDPEIFQSIFDTITDEN